MMNHPWCCWLLTGILLCFYCVRGLRIDAAYLHNVPVSSIVPHLESALQGIPADEPIKLDVSGCGAALGDEGIQLLVDFITNKSSSIQLVSQMNQISSEGAAIIMTKLVERDEILEINPVNPWLQTLDLAWNQFSESSDNQNFLKALRLIVESPASCPVVLRLESCGLTASACRSIAKGLMNRHGNSNGTAHSMSLYLTMNQEIGDAGVAALAAAIRTIAFAGSRSGVVFENLSLSACGITDAGAFALAQALESSPYCLVRNLDLSNNKIGEEGATALGRSLLIPEHVGNGPGLVSLDLSGNKDINDRGIVDVALAMEKGRLFQAVIRSCNIQAKGAASFGKTLRNCIASKTNENMNLVVDLSGNPLGILRGKQKDNAKYSASKLKSKASATAASYLGMFKKSLQDVVGSTLESDDEEEKDGLEDESGDNPDARTTSCGIKALATSLLGNDGLEEGEAIEIPASRGKRSVHLGLRRTFLDYGAADALAAMCVASQDEFDLDLTLDLDMNPVLEDDVQEAFQSENKVNYDDLLREMADRYTDAVEVLRDARRRAAEATDRQTHEYWPESDDDPGFLHEDFGDVPSDTGSEMNEYQSYQ